MDLNIESSIESGKDILGFPKSASNPNFSTTEQAGNEDTDLNNEEVAIIGTLGSSQGLPVVKKLSGIPETASMEVLIDAADEKPVLDMNTIGSGDESSDTLSVELDPDDTIFDDESVPLDPDDTMLPDEAVNTNIDEDALLGEAINIDLVLHDMDKEVQNTGIGLVGSPSMEVLLDTREDSERITPHLDSNSVSDFSDMQKDQQQTLFKEAIPDPINIQSGEQFPDSSDIMEIKNASTEGEHTTYNFTQQPNVPEMIDIEEVKNKQELTDSSSPHELKNPNQLTDNDLNGLSKNSFLDEKINKEGPDKSTDFLQEPLDKNSLHESSTENKADITDSSLNDNSGSLIDLESTSLDSSKDKISFSEEPQVSDEKVDESELPKDQTRIVIGSPGKSFQNTSNGVVPTIPEDQPLSIDVQHGHKDGSDDDEYFEEFYLPNTHGNAFVRHQSFRRKVKLTPINAPDAEHIEGIVRTGDLNRHGSIRRKILPEQEEDGDDVSYSSSLSSLSDHFRQDIHEIEAIIDKEEKSKQLERNTELNVDTSSTPIRDKSPALTEAFPTLSDDTMDSLMLGTITLKKIKKCMKASNHKSIYHLSGRLQDILTPLEIEEVLNNSDLYSPYLTAEVLEALSISLNEQGDNPSLPPEPDQGKQTTQNEVDAIHATEAPPADNNEKHSLSTPNGTLKLIPAPKIDLTSECTSDTTISALETTDTDTFEDTSGISEHSMTPIKAEVRKKVSVNSSPLSPIGTEDICSKTDRSGHIEINTIAPIARADPFIMSQYESVPPPPPDLIPEMNATEETATERHWRNVVIGGAWKRIDMKAIAPYKMAISHGGFTEDNQCAMILISSCLLPEKSKKDYNYVMDNLFMYALSFLEQLVLDDYILIYLAGGKTSNGPNFHWMRKAYAMIDRNIRKNLKKLLIVHPSLWSKTLIVLSRPFVSSKFYRKIVFVDSLTELAQMVRLDQLDIPDAAKQSRSPGISEP